MFHPKQLTEHIARIAPDVVHTHSGVWYKASLAARRAGVRWLIHTEHGRRHPDGWQHRLVDGLAARRTDAIVAVSERLANDLPFTLRTSAARVECILNGIDTEAFSPRADDGRLRAELGIQRDGPILGSIGRLEPIKAYELMIEAFALFLKMPAGQHATLVIAGAGSSRASIDRVIEASGVASRVHLLGWRDDVRDLHSAFSVFTMSSKSEGTSISLLEAMSAGIPPVVTDVGGNRAVLGATLTSHLVPFGDRAALAAAWASVLATPATRERASKLARARVLEGFGLARMARAYERLYERGEAQGRERARAFKTGNTETATNHSRR
jgi:glycosyltransferase involved in cell wall biosynthesis